MSTNLADMSDSLVNGSYYYNASYLVHYGSSSTTLVIWREYHLKCLCHAGYIEKLGSNNYCGGVVAIVVIGSVAAMALRRHRK